MSIDCMCIDSLNKCVWISPLRCRLHHFKLCTVCATRRCGAITLAVLWNQRSSWGSDPGIKACLFAFVPLCGGHQRLPQPSWHPYRIGLLYKNTQPPYCRVGVELRERGWLEERKTNTLTIPQKFPFCILLSEFSSFQNGCPSTQHLAYPLLNKSSVSK